LLDLVADLTREGIASTLPLAPLPSAEAASLLSALLPDASGTQDSEADRARWENARRVMLGRSGGVPFYLVSSAQELHAGMVPSAAGERALPWSAAVSIRQRVAALPPSAQQVLGLCAVIGREIDRDLLLLAARRAVLVEAEADLLHGIDAAVRARLLVEQGERSFAFAHDLIYEAIAGDLGNARVAAWHRSVAEALEHLPAGRERRAAYLAWHFIEAGLPSHALPHILAGGEEAEAVYAYAEAEEHYRTAMELARQLNRPEQEAQALERLSYILDNTARHLEAMQTAERAIALSLSRGSRTHLAQAAPVVAIFVRASVRAQRTDRGGQLLSEFIAALAPNEPRVPPAGQIAAVLDFLASGPAADVIASLPPLAAAQLSLSVAVILRHSDRPVDAFAPIERAFQYAQAAPHAEWACHVLMIHAGLHEDAGHLDAAIATSIEAARRARDIRYAWMLSLALRHAARAYAARGDIVAAHRTCVEAVAAAEEAGDPNHVVLTRCTASDVAFLSGDWSDALSHAERAEEVSSSMGPGYISRWPAAHWGLLRLFAGEREQGVAALEALLGVDPWQISEEPAGATHGHQFAERQLHMYAQQALAELDLLEERPQRARERLEPFADIITQLDANLGWLLPWAYLECGDLARADEVLSQVLADCRAQAMKVRLADALRVQAMLYLRLGQGADAAHALDEALSHARAIDYPYAEAKTNYVYGNLHLAQGDPAAASARFEQALAICERLGEGLYLPYIKDDVALVWRLARDGI
jgi:tetratricopeptide (TPR) repeat protein